MEHGGRRGILSKRQFFAHPLSSLHGRSAKESPTGRPEKRGSPGGKCWFTLFDYFFASGG
jgi:hypothetical protein